MPKEVIFDSLKKDEALILLRAFDYDVDKEGYILSPQGCRIPYEDNPQRAIKLEDAALTPGSLNVIDASPISLSKFIREGEALKNASDP